MRSIGVDILGGGLGTSFVVAHGSELGVSKESVGGYMFVIARGETYVAALDQ